MSADSTETHGLLERARRGDQSAFVVHDAPIPAVEGESIQVEVFRPGRYTVEYWDSWKGTIAATKQIETKNNVLQVELPKIERDIALKIRAR